MRRDVASFILVARQIPEPFGLPGAWLAAVFSPDIGRFPSCPAFCTPWAAV